ncbi:(Fe-S)-binding protein [Thioalkalivibrio sp. XN279]|uniref:(Fe-S)-binding protein n=1 Tax=Thioalkalivibrio sp. XN279 TaxID=2714953 RepID=UPI001409F294|nr:(Fe-S)-binding protein [Thioalkalivibrio sp. XN279]NHA13607.1 (Fe-S)-binding protein [Thioalkalivibrio sp. XN279]
MSATTIPDYGTLGERAAAGLKPRALSDEQKVAKAKEAFLAGMTADMATYLESCIHCGMCAEACHFYIATGEAKYTPIFKVEPLKKVYRRELAPLRAFNRFVSRDITVQDLEDWKELAYDSCTQCGRCSLLCPMGIHIQSMIQVVRNGLAAAGMAPAELQAVSDEQKDKGSILGAGADKLREVVERVRAKGIEVPLDKDKADVLVLSSALDFLKDESVLAATAKVMNKLGVSWTIRSDGFESANFGALSGDVQAQKRISKRVIDAAMAAGAKKVIVAECGHAYPVLRWEAATLYGKTLPFEILSVAEYLGQELKAGRLKVKKAGNGASHVTFHDPCKLGRMGGSFDESRDVLRALGVKLTEMESHGRTNLCCGGGGGVAMLKSALPLRQKAFELKREEVERTGAPTVVTACNTCMQNLEAGKAWLNWDKDIVNLVQLVSDNLA